MRKTSGEEWDSLVCRAENLGVAITRQNRTKWVVSFSKKQASPPLSRRWTPRCKQSCPVFKGMLVLGPNVFCVQRGYFPPYVVKNRLWEQFLQIAAQRFGSDDDALAETIKPYAWDFMIFVVANRTKSPQLVSGCLLEYRNSESPDKAPYLYIGELCTHSDFEHEGLASLICHGSYQLGNMMLKGSLRRSRFYGDGASVVGTVLGAALEGEDSSVWEEAIQNARNKLYIALMVKQSSKETYNTLVHLYTHCGFDGSRLPSCLDFDSITPYSPFPFLPFASQCRDDHCVAMYKSVDAGVIFKSNDMIILDPHTPPPDDCKLFVHSFDIKYLKFVKENGLVLARQRPLFADVEDDGSYFIHEPCGIYFSDDYCYRAGSTDNAVFVIRVQNEMSDDHIRSAVPVSMAVWVGESGLYKARFEAEILQQQKKRTWTVSNFVKKILNG